MNLKDISNQKELIELLDSIDIESLGIQKIQIRFDKEHYKRISKPNEDSYIEEFCKEAILPSLSKEYFNNEENNEENYVSKIIVTNKLD